MEGLATGRIVHYNQETSTHPPETCRAAIITHIWSDQGVLNLYVFPDGLTEEGGLRTNVSYQKEDTDLSYVDYKDPSWHWPERTPVISLAGI